MRGQIRRLEDGPYGGSAIRAGETVIGEMLDAPLPEQPDDSDDDSAAPWGIARIRDLSLAQAAHALVGGRLWFARDAESSASIPICNLGQFAGRGFIDRDINGKDRSRDGKPRGPFDISSPCGKAASYPCLWQQDAKKHKQMLVVPTSEGAVRIDMESRAHEVWEKASRVLHNINFQFNSQAIATATASQPILGGPAWLNVLVNGRGREAAYALWGNSTLGLLCYWWWANKQQEGRGRISPARLLGMPTLNVTALKPAQLNVAREKFDALKGERLLPFYRAAEDKTREELDRAILCEVLGLPKKVLSGVSLIREKLCAEPSVFGGKKTAGK